MDITAPKFEAVFNADGQVFRLLQDAFNPPEIVNARIAEHYKAMGDKVTFIIDDGLIQYMKPSFKRFPERRKLFPNYKVIGLSKTGFSPFSIPKSKVGTAQKFNNLVSGGTIVGGSTQLKRKAVLGCLTKFMSKAFVKELLFFISYSDETIVQFAQDYSYPMALMAADFPGPMSQYFGNWYDWYYLRASYQDRIDLALINSRTQEVRIPEPYPRGFGDSSFFKRNEKVEDWIDEHTGLSSGQITHVNVQPKFDSLVERLEEGNVWVPDRLIHLTWGDLGRGRGDSFGSCDSKDYGPRMVLRVKTSWPNVYYCGFFYRIGRTLAGRAQYTPLPVKNKATFELVQRANRGELW